MQTISDLYKQLESIKAEITQMEHSRLNDMISRYGECCTKSKAAQILSCSRPRITAMIADGRLKTTCDGRRVDVRSIAAYLEAPKQIDFETRFRKAHPEQRFYVV